MSWRRNPCFFCSPVILFAALVGAKCQLCQLRFVLLGLHLPSSGSCSDWKLHCFSIHPWIYSDFSPLSQVSNFYQCISNSPTSSQLCVPQGINLPLLSPTPSPCPFASRCCCGCFSLCWGCLSSSPSGVSIETPKVGAFGVPDP